jgi:hypothetical protein
MIVHGIATGIIFDIFLLINFKMNHVKLKNILHAVLFLMIAAVYGKSSEELLQNARVLFYKSVQDEKFIQPSIDLFMTLQNDERYTGRALTYIGALTALRGKHSFWPHDKLKHTKHGLQIMDQGRDTSPEDIEALFIHASTCYYLPFFFNRAEDAQQSLKKIIILLPSQSDAYDAEMVKNVVNFILQHAHLEPQQRETASQLLKDLSDNES